jgi:starch-binding outer membrane protein, SusD/RagB family
MDLNEYSLAAYTGSNTTNTVFIARRNSEVILSFLRPVALDIALFNGPIGYTNTNARGEGRTSPTQELVDAFPANNGRPVAPGTYPTATRDPRLVRSILFNTSPWLGRPVQTFEGGLDKPNNPLAYPVQTKTSYYSRKFTAHFTGSAQYSAYPMNFNIFRYTDVLLMYAEAVNEVNGGPTAEVYTILQDIRRRGGIIAGSAAAGLYGITPNMSQAQMRDFIRNERRIEFCFEEQRYWDVRRWKIAGQVLNQDLTGMRVSGSPLTYTRVAVDRIVFDDPRMYMYPIPNSEILRNPNLVQNMGW